MPPINYQARYTINIREVLKPLYVYSITLELLSGWPLTSVRCLSPNSINEGIGAQISVASHKIFRTAEI